MSLFFFYFAFHLPFFPDNWDITNNPCTLVGSLVSVFCLSFRCCSYSRRLFPTRIISRNEDDDYLYKKLQNFIFSKWSLTKELGRIWWNFSHEETLLKVLGKTCSTWYRRRNESITVSESTTGSRQVLRSGQDSFSEVLSLKSPVLDPAHSLFVC